MRLELTLPQVILPWNDGQRSDPSGAAQGKI